uniref:phosphatase PAP2 family protein n=1 Tax=Paludibacterium denitrificans TaxID=2675226 RepID=UPI002477DC33|nr:phosphatase PAP2 family protein [Paludibacterium denitrificans]
MPLLVVAVMLSRPAIGVHWPSDVLAGALLGWLVMRFSCRYLWPQGWPKTVTTCVQGGLLLLLWWLYGRQAVRHDADWLLIGIEGSVAVWGVVRLLWQQNRKQGSRF